MIKSTLLSIVFASFVGYAFAQDCSVQEPVEMFVGAKISVETLSVQRVTILKEKNGFNCSTERISTVGRQKFAGTNWGSITATPFELKTDC